MQAEISRNALCACGSGKRYKHCHGRDGAQTVPMRLQALAAHRSGQLGRAEVLYRAALDENPGDIDARHMLGVVQLQRLRYRNALDVLRDAAERDGWANPQIRHNLGIVLGKLVTREANARQADLLERFIALERARNTSPIDVSPRVTVVIPAFNHARFVGEAIASVAAQSYTKLELVVIDDGSTDGTREAIAAALVDVPFPKRFVARENRGAPATLNEGAALASGEYIAFLNSDDYYATDRIACLIEGVARRRVPWGFTLVSSVADVSLEGARRGAPVPDILQKQRNFMGTQPNSFTLVEFNVVVSSGNLFVERAFFAALGGFRSYRYNHDWDFCLRASALAEPAVVYRPLYCYRVHDSNTISESKEQSNADADRVVSDFLVTALAGEAPCPNSLAPQSPENRSVLLKMAFRAGQGRLVPVATLRALAAEWHATPAPAATSRPVATADRVPRTAVVVLGMHRSGTSAMSRVLNLCGARLPEKLKPPKIGVNPKGFWEPEAVLELNGRLMRQLGGDWDRVGFVLPESGDVVDEFIADAQALLASEYGTAATIVIKDPRICVLAPLWHRALAAAGYRPVYVVPVRNPLEVAQSLNARGDMSVERGLALWSTYTKRIIAFADGHADVIFVSFTELLEDWRTVVQRIASRLDVALDTSSNADEIGRFLELNLRNQAAGDERLEATSTDTIVAEARALYGECRARCAHDAAPPAPPRSGAVAGPPRRDSAANATLGFVLCIENNAIRDQALLLCESIRQFAGRHRDAPIMAFAPRPELRIDSATRARLAELQVEYIDVPLNTTCPDYPPANRVFAGAYAEANSSTDFLVVLDSDTVWLDEPGLPDDADAAVRPVDSKGSATWGPGDRFESYWATLAALCGITLDRLPMMRSTIGNELIRASYNAGLTMARRKAGILGRCATLFAASLEAGLRPYRGSGINIFASTGEVGTAGSEYWGSSQTAMTLAIWASTDRVLHYPDHYNVPLHLIAADGEIEARWLQRPPVHLHYHWMFGQRHHEVAMELLETLGVSADRLAWLRARTPFADA